MFATYLICTAASLASTPGLSQNAQVAVPNVPQGSADENGTGDIVVTAQRRTQNLQDVPISVTVTSGTALRRQNITNLEQLSVQLPAVKIAPTAASDQLHIRGAGSGLNSGFEQSVATFVDGIYRGRARSSRAALFDVDRVEVLKGPQTTFFGNNAIAGAFNITTRKPGDAFGYNATALYSPSDGEYNLEAGIDVPLENGLAVRFSGRASGMDGYIYNSSFNRDEPHLRDWIGRMNVVWRPSASVKSNLRVDVIRNRDRGTYSGELLNCPVPPGFGASRGQCAAYLAAAVGIVDDRLNYQSATGESLFRYDAAEVAFGNDITIGEHTMSLITGYFKHDAKAFSNTIPVPLPGVFGTPSPFPFISTESLSQFTQEVRITSPTGKRLEYMLGAYFLDGDVGFNYDAGFFFAPFSNIARNGFPTNTPVTTKNHTDQHERSLSLFGSATYHLSDALRISSGLRYTRVRKTGFRFQQAGASSGPPYFDNFVPAPISGQLAVLSLIGVPAADFPINRRVDDALLPSFTIQYDVARDVMMYGSYTKGFKAGGYSSSSRDIFDPEKVNAYELGLKSRFFDRSLTVNLALFLSDYLNLQEASQVLTGNSTISVVGNSASSRSKGVELGGALRISDNFSIRADAAYLDARYVDYRNAPCTTLAGLTPGCVQDLSGQRRAFAPEWSGSVGASLSAPVLGAQLKIEPTLAFSSSYKQQSFDPLYSQPAYAKVDLRVGLGNRERGWELAVIGRNLTDKVTAAFRNAVPTSPGSVLALPDRARSIAIQLTIGS